VKNNAAVRFVLTIGIVNFFADFTYEGVGELMGYGLRSVSGYYADRTHRYWAFAIAGYVVNMLAVPALALAGQWPMAAALVIAERTGRGIHKPTVEAMLSHAGKSIGAGWVFGLNEALDQAGATVGPLLMALVLYFHRGFRVGFATLLVPALLAIGLLIAARLSHPRPHELEEGAEHAFGNADFRRRYWLYLGAGALIAAGFADFALIGFHFHKANTVSSNLIPVYYAAAMASSALASIPLGRLFDRFGPNVSLGAFILSATAAPFVFLGSAIFALIGMILWGIGMSAQGSLFQAMLTHVIPPQKRSTAFGLFDTGYGIAWFAGSAIMGLLYDKSILALALFSVALQIAALPLLVVANRKR
jgi:predicted MFS family arabinose efflux permease